MNCRFVRSRRSASAWELKPVSCDTIQRSPMSASACSAVRTGAPMAAEACSAVRTRVSSASQATTPPTASPRPSTRPSRAARTGWGDTGAVATCASSTTLRRTDDGSPVDGLSRSVTTSTSEPATASASSAASSGEESTTLTSMSTVSSGELPLTRSASSPTVVSRPCRG